MLDKYRQRGGGGTRLSRVLTRLVDPMRAGPRLRRGAASCSRREHGGTTTTAPKRPFTVQEVRLSKPDAIVGGEPAIRRHHAQRSRVARGRRGRERTRVFPAGSAVRLGATAPVRQPAIRRDLDGVRAARETVRRYVLRRRGRLRSIRSTTSRRRARSSTSSSRTPRRLGRLAAANRGCRTLLRPRVPQRRSSAVTIATHRERDSHGRERICLWT